jgi:hypothetical protein
VSDSGTAVIDGADELQVAAVGWRCNRDQTNADAPDPEADGPKELITGSKLKAEG